MKQIFSDVLYLLSCAANTQRADKEKVNTMDLNALYTICKKHSITALVASVLAEHLKDQPAQYARWTQEQMKAVYRDMNFAAERAKILAFLEENGIWYMPLKGVILKEYYPKPELREFADNDILFDASSARQVKEFMLADGYALNDYDGEEYVDEYKKDPCFNFEMHRLLFHQNNAVGYEYYKDVKNRLLKDENNAFGYHFSDEDFYIFMIAHAYRHFADGGIGIRALLDTYIFNKAKNAVLDYRYVENELAKMNCADYEKQTRALAQKVFGGEFEALTKDEKAVLEYYFDSQTFGTLENRAANRMRKYTGEDDFSFRSRLKYWRHRVFDIETWKREFPRLYKTKILIPIIPVIRMFRGIKKWNKLKQENERLKSINTQQQ